MNQTRKLSYRKDDRAMRPVHGCPEKLRESLSTPKATFPEICNGLLFRSILRTCVQNLKFVALPLPVIIGVLKKFGQFLDTPTFRAPTQREICNKEITKIPPLRPLKASLHRKQ